MHCEVEVMKESVTSDRETAGNRGTSWDGGTWDSIRLEKDSTQLGMFFFFFFQFVFFF
jgi:hypothetical protein